MVVHYMTGKEDACTTKTKSGCGLYSESSKCYVFWPRRAQVTCLTCIEKIAKVEALQGHRL